MCDRWASFDAFLADMGPRPEGKSLDRINNDGNYEPGNCRWATRSEQRANQIRVHLITYNGETTNVAEWARRTGIPELRLMRRFKNGWPLDKMFTPRKFSRIREPI